VLSGHLSLSQTLFWEEGDGAWHNCRYECIVSWTFVLGVDVLISKDVDFGSGTGVGFAAAVRVLVLVV